MVFILADSLEEVPHSLDIDAKPLKTSFVMSPTSSYVSLYSRYRTFTP
jgi:hypothetical protein